MDYLNEAKKFLRSGRDHSFNNRCAEATADLLSAVAAGLIAVAEHMHTYLDEPIDSHPAGLAELARHLYSGCGEDVAVHEVGRCPLCQRPWAECDCDAKAER